MVMLAAMLAPPLGGLWRLLAENTLTVLALHSMASGVCLKIYSLMIGTDSSSMTVSAPAAALISAAVLVLCAIPAYIIQRWLPFMLGAPRRGIKRAA